jgi:hypothetical protein
MLTDWVLSSFPVTLVASLQILQIDGRKNYALILLVYHLGQFGESFYFLYASEYAEIKNRNGKNN